VAVASCSCKKPKTNARATAPAAPLTDRIKKYIYNIKNNTHQEKYQRVKRKISKQKEEMQRTKAKKIYMELHMQRQRGKIRGKRV